MLNKAAATYVTLVRNTPLLAVFFFFSFAAPRIGINFQWVDVHIGDVRLHLVLLHARSWR